MHDTLIPYFYYGNNFFKVFLANLNLYLSLVISDKSIIKLFTKLKKNPIFLQLKSVEKPYMEIFLFLLLLDIKK